MRSPKYQPKIWRISALPSNKRPGQKSFKFLVGILGETMTSSIHSEFNWPLTIYIFQCNYIMIIELALYLSVSPYFEVLYKASCFSNCNSYSKYWILKKFLKDFKAIRLAKLNCPLSLTEISDGFGILQEFVNNSDRIFHWKSSCLQLFSP